MVKKHLLALAAASLCASVWAAGPQPATTTSVASAKSNDATKITTNTAGQHARSAGDESDMLETKLRAAKTRADYAKVLESNGYRISAINTDKPDYLEYEIVKGGRTWEVQLDFDKGAAKATKIDVTSNLWRADSTKRMQQDTSYKHTAPLAADPEARYSDRRYMKAWGDEKGRLEHALPAGQTVAAYKGMIEKQGYNITSVNDRKADSVEYEIVKGDNSYEVQIDLDAKTKLGKAVDVSSNLWDAKGTERAKEANNAALPAQKR